MKKLAIVTGASSGMGREMVHQIADRFNGIDEIWAVARRAGRMDALRDQIPKPLREFAVDLTNEDSAEALKKALAEERPDVKLLVNAAGYGKIGPFGVLSAEEETGMVRLNCEALTRVTHLVLPYMRRHGRILQFASAAGFLPQPDFAVYAATKAYVLSFSRALHEELRGRGICVTAVCPGPVNTEFFGIAETSGRIPAYKRLTMADPGKVVRLALRDSMRGRSMSVYGLPMKGFYLGCRLLPLKLIFRIMDRLQ